MFEEGQLGAAPGGGGLTTYKELCSLATELGQPDLGERWWVGDWVAGWVHGWVAGWLDGGPPLAAASTCAQQLLESLAARSPAETRYSRVCIARTAPHTVSLCTALPVLYCLYCLATCVLRSLQIHGAGKPPGGSQQQPRRGLWVGG